MQVTYANQSSKSIMQIGHANPECPAGDAIMRLYGKYRLKSCDCYLATSAGRNPNLRPQASDLRPQIPQPQ